LDLAAIADDSAVATQPLQVIRLEPGYRGRVEGLER
jgi:hypothetical protein